MEEAEFTHQFDRAFLECIQRKKTDVQTSKDAPEDPATRERLGLKSVKTALYCTDGLLFDKPTLLDQFCLISSETCIRLTILL